MSLISAGSISLDSTFKGVAGLCRDTIRLWTFTVYSAFSVTHQHSPPLSTSVSRLQTSHSPIVIILVASWDDRHWHWPLPSSMYVNSKILFKQQNGVYERWFISSINLYLIHLYVKMSGRNHKFLTIFVPKPRDVAGFYFADTLRFHRGCAFS